MWELYVKSVWTRCKKQPEEARGRFMPVCCYASCHSPQNASLALPLGHDMEQQLNIIDIICDIFFVMKLDELWWTIIIIWVCLKIGYTPNEIAI